MPQLGFSHGLHSKDCGVTWLEHGSLDLSNTFLRLLAFEI